MFDVDYLVKILDLSKKEEYLLKLYISETVTKDEVYYLFNNLDYNIEKETLSFNFLLANLFQNNPHIEIPKDIEPRLKGVLKWFRYRNILLMSGLKQLTVALNNNDIPVLFIKGAAMRILEPNRLRIMADVDCTVDADNFNKTIKVSESLGFNVNAVCDYATEIKRDSIQKIDIHKNFIKNYKNTGKTGKKIFERAKQLDFYNSKIFIPNNEDMIFLLLINGYENIICSQDFYRTVSWLLDIIYIVKNNREINWQLVVFNAEETETLAQIKIMFEMVNYFLPDTIPGNIISSINVSKQDNKNFLAYTKKLLFCCKTQHLKEQVRDYIKGNKNFDFFRVTKLTIKFFYLKIIQKTPIIFDKVANRMFGI